MDKVRKYFKPKEIIKILAVIALWGLFAAMVFNRQDYRTAYRGSAGIAPLPKDEKGAVVLVLAARTFNWRGYFAVHSWIATKEKGADEYTTYQVIGWYVNWKGTAVDVKKDIPDRYWYAAKPKLIEELRGEKAEKAIPQIKAAVKAYPYGKTYHAWPGPNSNTFISYIIRNTEELTVELPSNAIGKDWHDTLIEKSESGSGYSFSIYGLLGVTLGWAEGIEINFLGLNFGIDLRRPALKLPMIGRIGFADAPLE